MGRSRSALDVEDRDEGYRRTILLVSFLVCFVLQPSRGTGQTVGAITGAINGTVTDTSGAVLPGVTIVASSDAVIGNKGKRTTVANGNGLYRFPALAPGEYQLVFTLDGFTTLEREGIYVGVGLTVTIDVEMHIATLQQKVTVVRNSPVIDQQSAAIVTTFDSHQLANLPGGRSMWAIQAATPAVYLPRFDLGATATGLGTAISAYGTAGSNRPMVEGISTSGINPTGFTLDYGVFEEVSVGTAAYGPEWPWSGVQMQFISLRRGRPADTTRGKLKTSIAGRGDPRPLVFGIRSNRVTPVELQQEFNETFTRGPSWSPYSDLARRAALESGEARDRKVEGAGARQQGLRPGEFDPER